jgi:uncharacterized protein (TIGR03435 family)
MKRVLAIAIVVACGVMAADPAFEVASVRTRTDGTGEAWTLQPFRFDFSGPRVTIENFALSDLITYAYDINDYQLFGEPHWAQIDRYNISAKAADDVMLTRDTARPMMRTLLAERFQLKVHTQMKEIPVYELVVAKGGSKLKPSEPGAKKMLTLKTKGPGLVMTVTGGDLAQLVGQFSKRNNVDRPVLDKTGLSGMYDYQLEWGDDTAAVPNGVPSVFTAFQQQLGLRLEPAKAAVKVLVVDEAQKPSEN